MSVPKQGPPIQIRSESQAQVERWRRAARLEGRSLSDWIRRALDDAAASTDEGKPHGER